MKRRGILRLTALLLIALIAVPALAAGGSDRRGLVGRSGSVSAYLDGEGGLFLTGYPEHINQRHASEIIWVDQERVVYLAGEEIDDFGGELIAVELPTFKETALADGVFRAAALAADSVFYIPAANRAQMMRLSLDTLHSTPAGTTAEDMTALHITPDGLVVELDGGTGALLYDTTTGAFTGYPDAIAAASSHQDGFYLRLSDEGLLSITAEGSGKTEFVDFGVEAYQALEGKVYYITSMGAQARLKEFDPAALSWKMLLALDETVSLQLAASRSQLFLIDESTGTVFSFDRNALRLTKFATVDLAATSWPEGYELSGLRIEGMSGQLNVYAVLSPVDLEGGEAGVPTFSFGDEPAPEQVADEMLVLIRAIDVPDEEKSSDVIQPEVEYGSLSRGSRGEDVRKLQQMLIELGYLKGKADGIFGSQTQYAVKLLQTDLTDRGFAVNGVASPEFQKLLFSGTLPAYDPYKPLSRGNSGLRVSILQERLRALGFLADAVDGVYGARTEEAVGLFQSENGMFETGSASSETLRRLYSSSAQPATGFIHLEKGDTGYRVKELNARLKELYYLEGTVGSAFNNATVLAVKRFQAEIGLKQNGVATPSVQQRLFSRNAPEFSGYITLKRGDANGRVADMQRRLSKLNYYRGNITGNFGSVTETAVRLFQAVAGLDVTGVANVETLTLLYSKDAPPYVEPTPTPVPTVTPTPAPGEVGAPKIGITPVDSTVNGVSYLDPAVKTVNFTWSADGKLSGYYVRVTDSVGGTLISQQVTSTSGNLSTSSLKANTVYTISVGAIPENGTVDNARWSHRRFALKGTPVPSATPTPVPTATPTPAPGQVGIPDVSIEPVKHVGVDMVNYVEPGTLTLRWSASGSVDHYFVEIFDGMWTLLASQEFTGKSTTLGTANMREGEVYTMRVTAVPVNGDIDDGKSNALKFALEPAAPEPTPSPTPVPTPTPAPTTTVLPVQLAKVSTNGGRLNLRKTPSTSGAIVARLNNGTVLTVIEKGNTWTKISHNGLEGFVKNSYVRFYMGTKVVTVPPTEAPTLPPPTTPPGDPETTPPGDPETTPPGDPSTNPPGDPPTTPPGDPSTTPPGDPPTTPPGDPPTTPPGDPETTPPGDPPTTPPDDPPTTSPGDPPTTPPGDSPTTPPGDPETTPPGDPPADPPEG